MGAWFNQFRNHLWGPVLKDMVNISIFRLQSSVPHKDVFKTIIPKKSSWSPSEDEYGSLGLLIGKCRHDIEQLSKVWWATACSRNDANQSAARYFNTGNHSVSDMEIWALYCVPFLEARIAAKDMKCTSFPNLVLSTPVALMNLFLCLTLSLPVWSRHWQRF
jgi:hypothetical protein